MIRVLSENLNKKSDMFDMIFDICNRNVRISKTIAEVLDMRSGLL